METTAFIIVIIQLLIIIALSIMNFKDQILNFYLGIRRKRAVFLDLRLSRYVTLTPDLKTFQMFNKTYVWNFEKELNNSNFYRSDMSEAVDAELDAKKCTYWCNSDEYHTNLKNKLLETLMMLRSKDQIIQLLYLCLLLSIITLVILWTKSSSMSESLEIIKAGVTALNQSRTQPLPLPQVN